MAPRCGDCGYPMRLCDGIGGGKFWGCVRWPECMGRVGAHADGRPLGRPANKETREARRRAHDAFDQLWKSGQMNRSEAYSLAAKLLNRSRESMHIALLDKEQCEELATKAARFLAK